MVLFCASCKGLNEKQTKLVLTNTEYTIEEYQKIKAGHKYDPLELDIKIHRQKALRKMCRKALELKDAEAKKAVKENPKEKAPKKEPEKDGKGAK
jgi:hypothetical protein